MAVTAPGVVVIVTAAGGEIAPQIAAIAGGYEVHGLERRCARADIRFDDVTAHLRQQFLAGRAVIAVCATGIVMRALGPVLGDKHDEPSVVCVSEDGQAVVPLLGGHRGANALAQRIAAAFGTRAALTTASDCRFGVALDAPSKGYILSNPEHYKAFAASLLANKSVRIDGDEAAFLDSSQLPRRDDATLRITVSDRSVSGNERHLIYHPQSLALGVGCERGAPTGDLIALVNRTLEAHQLAVTAVAVIVTLDRKLDEPALQALAAQVHAPLRGYSATELETQTPRLLNPSAVVFNAVGCHGVAEAAALAAVGDDGELVAGKQRSAHATCAIARAPLPIDPDVCGNARGSLAVVGIGPGRSCYRTSDAIQAIRQARYILGYERYLELIADLIQIRQTVYPYSLGQECERVAAAIALATGGERVALVCSGDPGIYAMASLVFEMLDTAKDDAGARIEVTVHSGISALQLAAARAGGVIGHDFCAVSLSDLLTPWSVIQQRLKHALIGDFVVALYNPSSLTRRPTFERALALIRLHRTASTVVVVARQLGRKEEEVNVIRLAELNADKIDMMTIVLIGNQHTRSFTHAMQLRAYTPRGYEKENR